MSNAGRNVGRGGPNNPNNPNPNAPPRIPLGTGRGAPSNDSGSIYSDFQPSRSPSLAEGEFETRYEFKFEDGLGGSDMDTDISSENSRAPSIFSYDSARDAPEMLKEENGRTFNNQNDVYYLPAGMFHRIHCEAYMHSDLETSILVDEREFNRLCVTITEPEPTPSPNFEAD